MANRENEADLDKSNRTGSKSNASTDPDESRILEAVLFASDELMNSAHLKTILPSQPDARRIRSMVEKINVQMQKERHPFEIVEIGGGYQFRTITYYHPWVRQIFKEKAAKKLSIQGLECLAIIAYKQPITKAEIEVIRGVVSDGAMKTLLEKRLVTITGRSEKPGRPLLYGTTQTFLKYFGLNRKEDLPRIEEFEVMAREKMEELSIDDLEQEEIDMKVDAVEETAVAQPREVASEVPPPGESSLFEVSLTEEKTTEAGAAGTPAAETIEPADKAGAEAVGAPKETTDADSGAQENGIETAASMDALVEASNDDAVTVRSEESADDSEVTIEVDAPDTAGNIPATEKNEEAAAVEPVALQDGDEVVEDHPTAAATDTADANGKTEEEVSDGDAVDLNNLLTEDTQHNPDDSSVVPPSQQPAHQSGENPMFELETTVTSLAELEKKEKESSAGATNRSDEEEVFEIGEVAGDAPAAIPPVGNGPEETSTFEIHLPESDQATTDNAAGQNAPSAKSVPDGASGKKNGRVKSAGGKSTGSQSRRKTTVTGGGKSKTGKTTRKRTKPEDNAGSQSSGAES